MRHRLATMQLILGAILLLLSSGVIVNARREPAPSRANVGAVIPPAMTAIPYPTSVATPTIARTPLYERPATPATATPSPPVTITPNSLAIGKLKLTTTFASIGIELPFGGDDNANATATLEFKQEGESTWRASLPLWAANGDLPAPGRAFYGSALLLKSGTKYDLRVTVADPDGVAGETTTTGSITTRADAIPQAAALKATYFVVPTGNDASTGTADAPWKTIDGALKSAPAGAIVQVAPGTYPPPTVDRKDPITLVAANPAVGDDREPLPAPHSIIAPQQFAAPAGTAGTTINAPWVQVALTGPATGAQYTVWKWSGSPVADATRLTIASDPNAVPRRVAYWDRKSGTKDGYTLGTPEGWAEVLYKNETYNFGFTSFGADIYARFPGGLNPNLGITTPLAAPNGSNKGRFTINAPNVRLSGFEIRSIDLIVGATASRGIVDHNLFLGAGLTYRGEKGTPPVYSSDQLVERNRFVDTGLWSTDPVFPAIPWLFIKDAIRIGGKATDWSRVGAEAETTAIGARGGARQTVVRYNTIDGFFNGIGGYNEGFDRYSQADMDIHDNLLRQISDDSFEPEQQAVNWRIWNNRLEEVSTGLSTGPVAYGPVYFFRNEVWRLGSRGVGADGRGEKGVGVVAFKFSGQSKPAARVFVVNNTFWTDQPGADGGNQYAGGGKDSERFYLRNNIFRMTRYAFAPPVNMAGRADRWDEDYNFFFTADPTRGLNYGSNLLDVGSYRAASGQGKNANRGDTAGTFRTEPGLVNAAGGNLTPAPGSPQIDAGVPVPNIADRAGIDYAGTAPDLGARERP